MHLSPLVNRLTIFIRFFIHFRGLFCFTNSRLWSAGTSITSWSTSGLGYLSLCLEVIILIFIVIIIHWLWLYVNSSYLTSMLENARHHDLFLFLLDFMKNLFIIFTIKMRWLITIAVVLCLDIGKCLKNFIDTLLHHTHINKHVAFSNTLVTKKSLVLAFVTFNYFRNLLYTIFNLYNCLLASFLRRFHFINLIISSI